MSDSTLVMIPLDQIEPDENQPRRMKRAGIKFRWLRTPGVDVTEALTHEGIIGELGVGRDDAEAHTADIDSQDETSSIDQTDAGDDRWDGGDSNSLAASIAEQGVLQPILVIQIGPDRYRIVAGERRWLAAKAVRDGLVRHRSNHLGDYDWGKIPALVINPTSANGLTQIQLVENIQRQNMSAMDIGAAIDAMRKSGETYRSLAIRLGKSTNWLQNMVTAASDEGIYLSGILKSDDWQYIRRLIAQRKDAKRAVIYNRIMAHVHAGAPFCRDMFEFEFRRYEDEQAVARGDLSPAQSEQDKLARLRAKREEQRQSDRIRANREPRPVSPEKAAADDAQEEVYSFSVSIEPVDEPFDMLDDRIAESVPPAPHVYERRAGESDLAFLMRTRGRVFSEQIEGVDDSRPDRRIKVPHMALQDDMSPYLPFLTSEDVDINSNVAVNVNLRISRRDAVRMAEDLARSLGREIDDESLELITGAGIADMLREYLARRGMDYIGNP